jgi:hypothetical protein
MNEITLHDFVPGSRNPWTMFFVYCKDGSSFIVKGHPHSCEQYVLCNCKHPCLVRYTYWKDGVSRGSWTFYDAFTKLQYWKNGQWLQTNIVTTKIRRFIRREGNKYKLIVFSENKKVLEKTFKRVPHKWIPEFDGVKK